MENKPQLFCFPYAGGTASFFKVIEKDLESIEVVKIEYAGHGERFREEFYRDFDDLADDVFAFLRREYNGGEYYLFGYSMGSISLVEVLKRIIKSNMKKPSGVFISAHEPHTKSELLGFSSDELDDWVKERTIQFGAVPEKLVNNRAFWRMYLPIYRIDYSIIGKYDFKRLDLRTIIPATIFYSEADTPLREMKLWEKYFTGICEYHRFDGTHFFILDHHSEMAEVILEKMRQ